MTWHTISRRSRLWLLIAMVMIVTGGCASAAGTKASGSNSERITNAEIVTARTQGISNLDELISRLRPRWLQVDRIQSFNVSSGILVYDGNSMVGGPDVLANYTLDTIREVRWLNSAQAGTLPGAGGMHVEGAIVIIR